MRRRGSGGHRGGLRLSLGGSKGQSSTPTAPNRLPPATSAPDRFLESRVVRIGVRLSTRQHRASGARCQLPPSLPLRFGLASYRVSTHRVRRLSGHSKARYPYGFRSFFFIEVRALHGRPITASLRPRHTHSLQRRRHAVYPYRRRASVVPQLRRTSMAFVRNAAQPGRFP